jgi:DNA-binding transcriptional LysR family regulator
MDLLLIRSFLAVSDAGAITDASANINVTQPALSRRIKQLESILGAELFIRGRKGVELTEIGRRVEQEGRLLVTRYDQLRAEVSRMQGLTGGTVRIGGGATAVSFVLPEAIAKFQSEHPEIHFQLKEAGSSEVARNVIDGALELGVVTLPVVFREFDVQPLMSDQIVLVARHDHILVQRENVTIEDLAGLSFVGFEAGSAIRQIIDNVLRDAGVEMNVVMELRSIPAILRMVATTGNLAFVSQLGLRGQVDVREIQMHELGMTRQLAIISKKGGRLSPAAQAFANVLLSIGSVTQDQNPLF